MYRFLDRPVLALPPGDQMLLWAMRDWVMAISARKCPCATLGPSFERWRVGDLLSDFNMTMFLLNAQGTGSLRFGPPGRGTVHDDEAALLALFHAAADEDEKMVGRLAAQLVKPGAIHGFIVALVQSSDVLRRTPMPRGSIT